MSEWAHAADWSPEEAEEWRRAYAAGEPVLLPDAEHASGECVHCDLLREWIRELHA